jgi:hypothetical protein
MPAKRACSFGKTLRGLRTCPRPLTSRRGFPLTNSSRLFPPSFSPRSAYSVYTLRLVIPRPRRITLCPTTVNQSCLKPPCRPTFRRRARRALPSRSFSSIPLLSIESGIRWNRTLHCRGESRSPFRVKTGHFSIYVYVYVTRCLIIQLKLLGCENDVLIMTALDLPFSSRVLAVSCAPFSFSTPFRPFLPCVSRHRRDPVRPLLSSSRFHGENNTTTETTNERTLQDCGCAEALPLGQSTVPSQRNNSQDNVPGPS